MTALVCDGCHLAHQEAREVTVRQAGEEGEVVVCPDCEEQLNGEIVDDPEVAA